MVRNSPMRRRRVWRARRRSRPGRTARCNRSGTGWSQRPCSACNPCPSPPVGIDGRQTAAPTTQRATRPPPGSAPPTRTLPPSRGCALRTSISTRAPRPGKHGGVDVRHERAGQHHRRPGPVAPGRQPAHDEAQEDQGEPQAPGKGELAGQRRGDVAAVDREIGLENVGRPWPSPVPRAPGTALGRGGP